MILFIYLFVLDISNFHIAHFSTHSLSSSMF